MTRRWLLVAGVGLLLVIGVVAWEYWPVALHYRQNRSVRAGRAAVSRYVAGEDSLDAAACRLAAAIRTVTDLSLRLSEREPVSQNRIYDVPIFLPPGANQNDPRVQAVMLNAYRNTIPDWFPEKARADLSRWHDSTIRARGFKLVDCPR